MTTLFEARTAYFEANGFGEDGGYSKPTVTVTVLGIPLSFPNTEGRKKAVVFHDMHHVLTGYQTSNLGEAEIGAWELGSGCRAYPAAWVLNTLALTMGIVQRPSRVFRAFVRGRHSRNLYGRDADALLDRDVGALKTELGLDVEPPRPTTGDVLAFVAHLVVSLLAYAAPLALIAWLVF
ncbi:MAG: hypothetical protein ACE37F_03900 [Nannocystaceae bacterium]|nr:hypothetical protein [bacterium]